MLEQLVRLEGEWGPFRLFGYISFRAGMALVTSLIVGFLLAPWVIGKLRKLKLEQTFRDEKEVGKLAELHAGKKHTPTMGGVLIYLSIVPSVLMWAKWNVYVLLSLLVYTVLSGLGFLDDYWKVSKKNTKGVSSFWKLMVQGGLTLVVVGVLLGRVETHELMSQLWVPFWKHAVMEWMPIWFIFIFYFFVMSGASNAINLTDGVDGLAIGCVIPTVMVFGVMAYFAGNGVIAEYLQRSYIPGAGELTVMSAGVLGAAVVFLWYNAHPAEVFMGDTGSLGLGGLVGTLAFLVHEPVTLVIVGGVFVMEAMSVIMQIISFKATGKRIFRMSPLHHHFELGGWHETKVVIRFWILSMVFALIGLASLKLR